MSKDLTGMKFGRLTVVEASSVKKSGKPSWLCICECGEQRFVIYYSLTSGHSKSCGCLSRDTCAKRALKHGNSQYVPMLVEALKAINNEQSCGNHTAQEALNNLPEELRG